MAVKIITAPAVEPLDLAQVKPYLRNPEGQDDVIDSFISAARRHVEKKVGRSLITQTLEFVADAWPEASFDIPRGPLQSVTSIKWKDDAAVESTVAAADYIVNIDDERNGFIHLASAASWPSGSLYASSPIRVRYVAGYGADGTAVPDEMRLAMLMLIASWYRNREAVLIGSTSLAAVPMPMGVQDLIEPYRDLRFA